MLCSDLMETQPHAPTFYIYLQIILFKHVQETNTIFMYGLKIIQLWKLYLAEYSHFDMYHKKHKSSIHMQPAIFLVIKVTPQVFRLYPTLGLYFQWLLVLTLLWISKCLKYYKIFKQEMNYFYKWNKRLQVLIEKCFAEPDKSWRARDTGLETGACIF